MSLWQASKRVYQFTIGTHTLASHIHIPIYIPLPYYLSYTMHTYQLHAYLSYIYTHISLYNIINPIPIHSYPVPIYTTIHILMTHYHTCTQANFNRSTGRHKCIVVLMKFFHESNIKRLVGVMCLVIVILQQLITTNRGVLCYLLI